MASYRLSKAAAADLDEIFHYTIRTFGLEQAERYYLNLKECLRRVADDPRLGRPIAGRSRTFPQYNCRRHGIFYVLDEGGVFVVRILHLRMNLKRHLLA